MQKNKFRGFNNVIAWVDLESGGLSKKECPILSFAIIITKNMKEVARKEFRFRPANNEIIQQQALEINGFKLDQIKKFPLYEKEIKNMENFLKQHIYLCKDQKNKFFIGGHNVIAFDTPFLKKWIEKRSGEFILDSLLHTNRNTQIDTKIICQNYRNTIWQDKQPENHKLTTLSEFYGFDTSNAHDATDDVERTIKLYNKICRGYAKNTEKDLKYLKANK